MELLLPFVALGGLYSLTHPRRKTTEEGFAARAYGGGDDDAYGGGGDYDFDVGAGGGGARIDYDALPALPSVLPVRAGTRAGAQIAAHSRPPPFEPIDLANNELAAPPLLATDFVVPAPRAARRNAAAGAAFDAGGPTYTAAFYAATDLGGGAVAAPFFSGKHGGGSGLTHADSARRTLDSLNGGNVHHKKKQASAPLFAPQADLSHTYGTPVQTDLFRTWENVSLVQNGAQPQAVSEGRGLTLDRAAVAANAGNATHGHVDALHARDTYHDRTVDDLRTANHPKVGGLLFAGFEAPAYNANAGGQLDPLGPTPKNRPDTAFENGQDRWGAPTSFQHTQTLAPQVIEHITQRQTQDWAHNGNAYGGAAGVGAGAYSMEQEYNNGWRQELADMPLGQLSGGLAPAAQHDYGAREPLHLANNRSSAPMETYFGAAFTAAVGRVAAPLFDALQRPSKRAAQADTHPSRPLGNLSGAAAAAPDADWRGSHTLLPATLRDETMLEDYLGQASAAESQIGAYRDQNLLLRPTERESTTAFSEHSGFAQAQAPGQEALPGENTHKDRNRVQTLHGRLLRGNANRYNPAIGKGGHRNKPDAQTAPAPVAAFVSRVPDASSYGAIESRYSSAPDRGAAAAADAAPAGKRRKAGAAGGGGKRIAPIVERDQHDDLQLDADIRRQLQRGNPLAKSGGRL